MYHIILITILAFILRLIALLKTGELWNDELFSWYFASQKSVFDTVLKSANEDIHMPLYFAILHFWIKLFNDSANTMRALSLILSIGLIPLSYFVSNKLFNKQTAIFASLFLSLNTFCIYYSLEVRFYCLSLILSLFCAYFFERQKWFYFVLCIALLFYTFSITPLLLLSYFVIAFIYLIYKKEKIKDFLLAHCFLALITLPAIIWTIKNIIEMHTSLTFFPEDTFIFSSNDVLDVFENFFSFDNFRITKGLFALREFNLLNPIYLFFTFIPILIGCIGLIKGMISKNKTFNLLFYPVVLFFIALLILSIFKLAVFQTRYLCVIFPSIVICFCFGLTQFKNKIISIILFILMILLSSFGLIFQKKTIYNIHRTSMNDFRNYLNNVVQLKNDDLILAPLVGNQLTYYIDKGNLIPFSVDGAFVLKDKKSRIFYFGDDAKKLNRYNSMDFIKNNVINDIPIKTYEYNLKREYIDNLKENQRIVYIAFLTFLIQSPKEKNITYENYSENNRVGILLYKALRDSLLILGKYMTLENSYTSPEGYSVFVFRK